MRKLIVFHIISLDGYYTGPGNNVMVLPMGGVFDASTSERLHVNELLDSIEQHIPMEVSAYGM
jgi:hypothetical protein